MIIFLTDQQQTAISRDLSKAMTVLTDIGLMSQAFNIMGWTGPEYRMDRAHTDLTNALRSIAKTMQDASEIEPAATLNETMGERV